MKPENLAIGSTTSEYSQLTQRRDDLYKKMEETRMHWQLQNEVKKELDLTLNLIRLLFTPTE